MQIRISRVKTAMFIVLLLGIASCASHRAPTGPLVETIFPGYSWQNLGNGIYLHGRTDPFAGPVDGNSVVIINDSSIVVVDTHINPAAARAVIAKIRQLSNAPVTYVVNTHAHDDHTNGNAAFRQAYPGCKIVAHRETAKELNNSWSEQLQARRTAYEPLTSERVNAAADQLEASDPDKALTYRIYAGYIEALKPELGALEPVYPDTVVDEHLEIDSGGRTVVVEWLGAGNTRGDLVVWVPEDKILITGDMVVAPIPYAFGSPMLEWPETLKRLLDYQADVIVPGHGPAMNDTRYIEKLIELFGETAAKVRVAAKNGTGFDELSEAIDLSQQEQRFTSGEAGHAHAWNEYFFTPGLKSAWTSLGLAIPE